MAWKGEGAVFSTRKTFRDAAVLALRRGIVKQKNTRKRALKSGSHKK